MSSYTRISTFIDCSVNYSFVSVSSFFEEAIKMKVFD